MSSPGGDAVGAHHLQVRHCATLSLAAGAVSSGTSGTGDHGSGFSSVLAGGALLLMATFVPFAILRMIPAVEAGAVAHLDGLRERGMAAMTRVPRTAASHALHEGLGALGDSRLLGETAGGGGGGGAAGLAAGAGALGGSEGGIGMGITEGEGDPDGEREFQERVGSWGNGPKGPKPVLPAPVFSEGSVDYAGTGPGSDADTGAGAGGGSDAALAASGAAAGSASTGFELDPADRVGATAPNGALLGPRTPEDIWMWQGVPPGRSLMTRYEPGDQRFYMDDDGGPSAKWLPRAWPPGQGPDA